MNNFLVFAITLISTYFVIKCNCNDNEYEITIDDLIKKEIIAELKNTKDRDELLKKVGNKFNSILKDKIEMHVSSMLPPTQTKPKKPEKPLFPKAHKTIHRATSLENIKHDHFNDLLMYEERVERERNRRKDIKGRKGMKSRRYDSDDDTRHNDKMSYKEKLREKPKKQSYLDKLKSTK